MSYMSHGLMDAPAAMARYKTAANETHKQEAEMRAAKRKMYLLEEAAKRDMAEFNERMKAKNTSEALKNDLNSQKKLTRSESPSSPSVLSSPSTTRASPASMSTHNASPSTATSTNGTQRFSTF